MQRAVDVRFNDVGIDEQRGGEDVVEILDGVGGVERKVGDHHFVAHGEIIPIKSSLLKRSDLATARRSQPNLAKTSGVPPAVLRSMLQRASFVDRGCAR